MSMPTQPGMGWRRWVLGARVRTLPAAVAPVLVGTAVALDSTRPAWGFTLWRMICALGVALFVQIGTNFANDYSDGSRGTDDPSTRVGPPRLVGSGLADPGEVKLVMLIAFGLTLAAGAPLVLLVDWRLALVGLTAVTAGWFYTGGPRPYGYAGLGEAFVFVFFGLVATMGAAYVQRESLRLIDVGCGAAMGFLATSLLIVNNLRDIPGDTTSGKRTLAVRLGENSTRALYASTMAAPFVLVPFLAGASGRILAVAAFLALPLCLIPVRMVLGGARGGALMPVLAATARVQLVYGALLSVGLALSA